MYPVCLDLNPSMTGCHRESSAWCPEFNKHSAHGNCKKSDHGVVVGKHRWAFYLDVHHGSWLKPLGFNFVDWNSSLYWFDKQIFRELRSLTKREPWYAHTNSDFYSLDPCYYNCGLETSSIGIITRELVMHA